MTPSQNEEKSSSAYGLAATNDASAPTPTMTMPAQRPRPPAGDELRGRGGDDRQQHDPARVLRRAGQAQAQPGPDVIPEPPVAQDPRRAPQAEADAGQRGHVVERELGVEDRQERDREDAGRQQADAAVDEPRAGEVQQPDGDRAQHRGDRARDDPDLRRIGGEGVRDAGAAAVPDAEHEVHEVRVGRRVDVVVGVPVVAEQADRAGHEVRVLVGVVGVGQAVAVAPDAQQEGEQQQRADRGAPDQPLAARPAQGQARRRQQARQPVPARRLVGVARRALNS